MITMWNWFKVITVVIFILEYLTFLKVVAESDTSTKGANLVNKDSESQPRGYVDFSNFGGLQIEPEPPTTSYVPEKVMEYMFRVYGTNCSCPQTKKQVNIADKLSKNIQHLPFGVPYSHEDNVTLRLLYNDDYVTAFDVKYRIPMWTSFTLDRNSFQKNAYTDRDVCWTGDARIGIFDTAQCGDYDTNIVKRNYVLQRPVFPLDFSNPTSEDQVAYITNSIPKSLNHTRIVEKDLYQILKTWSQESGELNIVMGPAFDLDHNETRPFIGTIMRTHAIHGPLIVPTHMFVVATWCTEKDLKINECDSSKLSAHSFLVPNKPFPEEDAISKDLLQKSSTSVTAIEKLTAITFYTRLPVNNAVRLRKLISERRFSDTE